MIVRGIWPACRRHHADPDGNPEGHPPKRCFFVGAEDGEVEALKALLPAHQAADMDQMDPLRRDEWYRIRDVSSPARAGMPRYWWFLVADDLSRADLCSGVTPLHEPAVEPYFAEVSRREDLAGLP